MAVDLNTQPLKPSIQAGIAAPRSSPGTPSTPAPASAPSARKDAFESSDSPRAQLNEATRRLGGERVGARNTSFRTYTVQAGDTLSGIAERFGSTVRTIASHNGISNPDFIYPGQQLRIPRGNSTPGPVTGPDGVTPSNKLERNVRTAMDYAQSLVGAPYAWWTDSSGPLGEGAPAWAANGPAPDPGQVHRNGVFCAGVANLMLRAIGKGDEIPRNWPYNGGTRAWYNKYADVAEPFNPNKDYPEGTLFIRNYQAFPDGSTADQGHVAIMQANGNVLQSHPGAGWVNGVSNTVSLADSNYMGDGTNYYELAVLPENWLG